MKTRNPVAGNAWRYNKPQIVKDKKKEERNLQSDIDAELYETITSVRKLNNHKLKEVVEFGLQAYLAKYGKPVKKAQ